MNVHTVLMGGLRWRQTLYTSMWGVRAPSPWLQVGLAPLWLASQCYRGLAYGHLASYTWGVRRRHKLPCAVVSIGNLTLGGTGKTPLTVWVARWYQQQGWRVAVLSRGYGAQPPTRLRVVSSGNGFCGHWQSTGVCHDAHAAWSGGCSPAGVSRSSCVHARRLADHCGHSR